MKPVDNTDFYRLFSEFILSTDCRQRDAISILEETLDGVSRGEMDDPPRFRVLDFGCGPSCPHKGVLEGLGLLWTGVDIESSDSPIVVYDGINLPFPDRSFDIVFSAQVLEHLQEPDRCLSEIGRVTKGEGYFIGSVAQLEPFHAMSTFNMTPFGLKSLLDRNGFRLNLLAPGIDFLSLVIIKLIRGVSNERISSWIGMRFWESESPLNRIFNIVGKLKRLSAKEVNIVKLKFAGHYCWVARKT
jgi:SAM-dependent methyltransferase